jgi:hypothetical protein
MTSGTNSSDSTVFVSFAVVSFVVGARTSMRSTSTAPWLLVAVSTVRGRYRGDARGRRLPRDLHE